MTGFTSLRIRLVGAVLVAIIPAWVLMYWLNQPVFGFITGLLALAAAWYGGERFILRQVRALSTAAQRLAAGDLRSRTGMARERGELGELARTFDRMAEALEKRVHAEAPAQDAESVKQMVARGLQVITLDAKAAAEFRSAATTLNQSMRGSMVPPDIYDIAVQERDAVRKSKGK